MVTAKDFAGKNLPLINQSIPWPVGRTTPQKFQTGEMLHPIGCLQDRRLSTTFPALVGTPNDSQASGTSSREIMYGLISTFHTTRWFTAFLTAVANEKKPDPQMILLF